MTIEDEAQAADEREALARVISYKGYPSIGDYEEADAILAAGFRRHPQPTEGEPSEAQVEAASRAWNSGSPTPNNWENMTERLRDLTRERMRAALRAARVADQEGENR